MSGTAESGSNRVTVGELARRLDKLEESQERHHDDLVRRLDALTFVDRETLDTKLMLQDAHRNDLERRISALESANLWLWRTIVGAIIAAVVVAVLASAGLPR